jgi:hydrogenase expression/formation protein HypD
MKYVDEFRNPNKAKALLREIEKLIARIEICRHRSLSLMEVCGGHTHTIFKFGVETMLPDAVELCMDPDARYVYCQWGGSMIASHSPRHRA